MTAAMTLEKSFIIEDRNKYINRVDILSKIKLISSILPDGENMTIKAAAKYYEVDRGVIERYLTKHKEEFEQDGVRTISKRDSEFKVYSPALPVGQHTLKLVSRRALLRLGMLLKGSEVAEKVRDYLVNLDGMIEPQMATNDNLIHSNNNQNDNNVLMQQLEQFKVNTGLVKDMEMRIKELEYELNLKNILLEDQRKVVALTQKAINKLKRDNKELREDQKAIQRIVFKSMMADELQSQCENSSYAYERDMVSGLVTKI